MSLVFSSSDSEVIGRSVNLSKNECMKLSSEDLEEEYELKKCVHWIKENGYTKIALQFPDEMLINCTAVCMAIQKEVNCQVFVLADTSYGSCCVDEIAAEHVSADAIIHFGRSCLSSTSRLPVLYVFGKQPLDSFHAVEEFKKTFHDNESHVVLLYDVVYSHSAPQVYEELQKSYPNLLIGKLDITLSLLSQHGNSEQIMNNICSASVIRRCGRLINLPSDQVIDDYCIFYIGLETLSLKNFLVNFSKCRFCVYDPIRKNSRWFNIEGSRLLKRSYYLIECVKDARIIGILVGTLAVSNYRDIIDRLKTIIKLAGKKSYTLIMGKINPAKIANFPEIDVFVLVACGENSLIDSKEYYKPIVTPFEVELGCNKAREWTGDYISDFRELLPGSSAYADIVPVERKDFDVSLVTGRVRVLGSEDTDESQNDGTVAVRNDMLALSALHANSEFLLNRSWRGLEQKLGETPVAITTEGQKGIASRYEGEGQESS
ncbi:2-(3-amino-3-carboxypropyl)histidine synthase subunit 2-like [Limulus polyphemus]|uniref:2-(3-amino-3-carboxypropyl)histidine synthase subunit 2 n=1 Tax=Limulus polyphemus TaxID=6850 RepID=A0ABM1S8L7_LIMPO|nr:2-(3-amino-3-carboxypropyl)histidine synthase subunit 2-like [Limulus polyphemus]XP_022239972.1 2-(3-amino-3-carboxypropyl)histidine synthase subunit 2-like [Limulus polyphemus]XP_022239973.1 2-(3-amino-3-carboxypropyl)histidine synthase subunit 2-like [Limulus polyphemus]XP_022239974.1 2-(3-amino-3-carboxypropyl)histidine synthase subunit 2-like [Limulus polyphemus]